MIAEELLCEMKSLAGHPWGIATEKNDWPGGGFASCSQSVAKMATALWCELIDAL